MITVHIPFQMRDLTSGTESVEVEGRSVREIVRALDARFAGFEERVTQDGRLAPGLAVVIDNEVNSLGILAKVPDGSVVHFVPAIAGGI
ncbi:MAG: MoaD/ThiS family protein [Planctomycetota bacterium]